MLVSLYKLNQVYSSKSLLYVAKGLNPNKAIVRETKKLVILGREKSQRLENIVKWWHCECRRRSREKWVGKEGVATTGGGLFLVSMPNYFPLPSTLSKMYNNLDTALQYIRMYLQPAWNTVIFNLQGNYNLFAGSTLQFSKRKQVERPI